MVENAFNKYYRSPRGYAQLEHVSILHVFTDKYKYNGFMTT